MSENNNKRGVLRYFVGSTILVVLILVGSLFYLTSSSFVESYFDDVVDKMKKDSSVDLSFASRKIDLWGDIVFEKGKIHSQTDQADLDLSFDKLILSYSLSDLFFGKLVINEASFDGADLRVKAKSQVQKEGVQKTEESKELDVKNIVLAIENLINNPSLDIEISKVNINFDEIHVYLESENSNLDYVGSMSLLTSMHLLKRDLLVGLDFNLQGKLVSKTLDDNGKIVNLVQTRLSCASNLDLSLSSKTDLKFDFEQKNLIKLKDIKMETPGVSNIEIGFVNINQNLISSSEKNGVESFLYKDLEPLQIDGLIGISSSDILIVNPSDKTRINFNGNKISDVKSTFVIENLIPTISLNIQNPEITVSKGKSDIKIGQFKTSLDITPKSDLFKVVAISNLMKSKIDDRLDGVKLDSNLKTDVSKDFKEIKGVLYLTVAQANVKTRYLKEPAELSLAFDVDPKDYVVSYRIGLSKLYEKSVGLVSGLKVDGDLKTDSKFLNLKFANRVFKDNISLSNTTLSLSQKDGSANVKVNQEISKLGLIPIVSKMGLAEINSNVSINLKLNHKKTNLQEIKDFTTEVDPSLVLKFNASTIKFKDNQLKDLYLGLYFHKKAEEIDSSSQVNLKTFNSNIAVMNDFTSTMDIEASLNKLELGKIDLNYNHDLSSLGLKQKRII